MTFITTDGAFDRYRFALYSRADKLGLAVDRGQPVALFACQATAEAHGRKLYGEFAEVVELITDHMAGREVAKFEGEGA